MYSEKERRKILDKAEKHVKKGKIKEAIAEYQKLLSEDAEDINVRSLIGDLYLKSNKKEKAIDEFKKMADLYENKGLYSQSLAIYKKIKRLEPQDTDTEVKLADLYSRQGYLSEAKAEYLRLARRFQDNDQIKEAISLYEKATKLDEHDQESKLNLAELYSREELVDKALEKFNQTAELNIKEGNIEEAKAILEKAKNLREKDLRTLANLIEIYKRENKKEKVIELVHDILKKDENNLRGLSILGNIYFEEKNFTKAEQTFKKIISLRPKDVESRVKLGKIHILEEKQDEAFKLYEPLIDSLLRKQKEGKAIGLAGLILAAKKPHIPTLEKLASIYKSSDQKRNLEITYRALLGQYRRENLKEKSLSLLKEFINIWPLDKKAYSEYKKLRRELGLPEEEKEEGETQASIHQSRKMVEESLAKADLYIGQGLLKNARRILEELRIKFPDESRIEEKIVSLDYISAKLEDQEIPRRVEEVSEKETRLFGKKAKQEIKDQKLTAADIFAETDIVPEGSPAGREQDYYDLKDKVEQELDVIQAIRKRQIKGDTAVVEKELSDILSRFKRDVEGKIDKQDYESRFNLAIAYLEQGLIEEAIAELKLASQDEKRAMECFSVLSACYRGKGDLKQAISWIEKALGLAEEGSSQNFRLKYELAALNEEIGERNKALRLYKEIKEWDPRYRDVAAKIEKLS
ncbi:MAG: tetratricopeptide repeat protein [Candidatus Aminicenantes bacterium]